MDARTSAGSEWPPWFRTCTSNIRSNHNTERRNPAPAATHACMSMRPVQLDAVVDGVAPFFGQRLQRDAAQDTVDGVADLAPHIAHRARLLTRAGRRALLEAFHRSVVALDYLDDIRHRDSRRGPRQHIAAAGTLLAGDQPSALELDQQAPQVVFWNFLGGGYLLDPDRQVGGIALREQQKGFKGVINAYAELHFVPKLQGDI